MADCWVGLPAVPDCLQHAFLQEFVFVFVFVFVCVFVFVYTLNIKYTYSVVCVDRVRKSDWREGRLLFQDRIF